MGIPPPSVREENYSSLPSKQFQKGLFRVAAEDGFRAPPMLPAPGRTQPTPSASRSIGAELAGELTSVLGIMCSNLVAARRVIH